MTRQSFSVGEKSRSDFRGGAHGSAVCPTRNLLGVCELAGLPPPRKFRPSLKGRVEERAGCVAPVPSGAGGIRSWLLRILRAQFDHFPQDSVLQRSSPVVSREMPQPPAGPWSARRRGPSRWKSAAATGSPARPASGVRGCSRRGCRSLCATSRAPCEPRASSHPHHVEILLDGAELVVKRAGIVRLAFHLHREDAIVRLQAVVLERRGGRRERLERKRRVRA